MKLKLHHLNLCSKDVSGMEEFYRSVLDLEQPVRLTLPISELVTT